MKTVLIIVPGGTQNKSFGVNGGTWVDKYIPDTWRESLNDGSCQFHILDLYPPPTTMISPVI